MTNEKKLELIAEILDVEKETLTPKTNLSDLEEWDSIALISFMAMMDDEFDKIVKGADVKAQKTIKDLMDLMEE